MLARTAPGVLLCRVITVLFFGRLRDAAGTAELRCTPPAGIGTIAELRAWLGTSNAALGDALSAPGVRVALDQRFCASDAPLSQARELAFMAPLSGG